METWITDYQVATEPWELHQREPLRHSMWFSPWDVHTARSEYHTDQYKKNGELKKNAVKSSRIVCFCRNKQSAELIVMEHNLNIKGNMSLASLMDVTRVAVNEYLDARAAVKGGE